MGKLLLIITFALALGVPAFAAPGILPVMTQQPDQASAAAAPKGPTLMREYRDIKLGLSADQVRAIMGKPELTEKEKDRYRIGGDDRLTVYYQNGEVKAIQLFITDPKRAPAWPEVIGDAEIIERENGSKQARRVVSEENFWVSMYQSKDGTITTITISR